MKIPRPLEPLLRDGLLDEVIRPLMSGKEAAIYMVRTGDELRCAKVYKDAQKRNFKNRAIYQDGRGVRGSRRARAMGKRRSRYGRQELEGEWHNAEVDALFTLANAGVRVPTPHTFHEGVLLMELVTDGEGQPAPRLNDLSFTPEEARAHHRALITDVVKMLCAGIIHGDLSEYNVLVDPDGPVIIDLPQAVNAAGNQAAELLFQRDVDNLAAYFSRFAPELAATRFGKEIWKLYKRGELHPDYELTGLFEEETKKADVRAVLRDVADARKDHERRQPRRPRDAVEEMADAWQEQEATPPGRRVVDKVAPSGRAKKARDSAAAQPAPSKRRRRRRSRGGQERGGANDHASSPTPSARVADAGAPDDHGHTFEPPLSGAALESRRRRRRRRPPSGDAPQSAKRRARGKGPSADPPRAQGARATTDTAQGEASRSARRRRRRRRSGPKSD